MSQSPKTVPEMFLFLFCSHFKGVIAEISDGDYTALAQGQDAVHPGRQLKIMGGDQGGGTLPPDHRPEILEYSG